PLVLPVGRGAVAGDDPGHERAVAELVVVGVVAPGEVDAADDPAGEVGHRRDAGVDEGHGDAGAVDALGPEPVGTGDLRVDGRGGVERGGIGGLDVDGGIGADVGDAGFGGQPGDLAGGHVGGHAVDDPQVLGDRAVVGGHGRRRGALGGGLDDDCGVGSGVRC